MRQLLPRSDRGLLLVALFVLDLAKLTEQYPCLPHDLL